MAAALGARVALLPTQEIGWAPVALTAAAAISPLRHLAGLDMLHWHGDAFDLPQGATLLASTPRTPNQAFSIGEFALATQFHAEVAASKIEAWLIGHTAELRAASVAIGLLRESSVLQHREMQEQSARGLLNEWLSAAELSWAPALASRRCLLWAGPTLGRADSSDSSSSHQRYASSSPFAHAPPPLSHSVHRWLALCGRLIFHCQMTS